jgi:hypothetical protein
LFILVLGRREAVHYYQAVLAPIKWEIKLIRNNPWPLAYVQLQAILRDKEALINHNLSIVYRNLFFSLLAFSLHRVSTIVYFGDRAVQISIFTALIVLTLLVDVARRARRIYFILQLQEVASEGLRRGSLNSTDEWLPEQLGSLRPLDQHSLGFGGEEFDALLDDETRRKLREIQSRSEEDVSAGLVKTGIFTSEGKLTKRYGGSE